MDKDQIHPFMTALIRGCRIYPLPYIVRAAREGATPFQILAATLISLRTRDKVTETASRKLFQVAKTPREVLNLGEDAVARLIAPASFYPTKARRLTAISHLLMAHHDGRVPADLDQLLALPGVGRKTANLVLAEGFKLPGICVDTHVHRITNRLGLAETHNPHETETVLRQLLPVNYRHSYPEKLVILGQNVCRPRSPLCMTCPVRDFCRFYQNRQPI